VEITDGGTITEVDGFYFPTDAPTKAPTASPTVSPTASPTVSPTASPTSSPTAAPTPTPTGTIAGTVFEDANNNGKQDPGEPGLPNVTVVITDSNGDKTTVTTDSNGNYSVQLPVGPATIEIVESTLPDGAIQTVGSNPSTVEITDGGTITEVDGFYFPTDAPTKAPTASPTAAPTPEPCINATITFDTDADGNPLAPGEYVEYEWAKFGLVLSASGGVGDRPRLFDTANPRCENGTGGDPDLGAPNRECDPPGGPGKGAGGAPDGDGPNCDPLGNVLIVQEPGADCPDDVSQAEISILICRCHLLNTNTTVVKLCTAERTWRHYHL
jgi:hypothetical protein